MRATLSNFASDSPQQGASTITMQVVKNDFLAGLERDGRYKLLQVHYALMLDREYTKDQILERYLNTVFFGNNAYGIQAAAETYFGKTADQLTFIEAAFLAGLVRSPSAYDPINNPERSRARFVQVLDRLVDDGYITEAEADRPGHRLRAARSASARSPSASTPRTYYTEALRDYLLNRSNILGDDVRRALQHAVPRRPAHPHHVQPDPPGAGRARPATSCPTRRRASTPRSSRWTRATGAIRAMVGGKRLRAQRARGQHGAAAPPDRARASSCSCSPPRCRPAPSPTTSSTGQTNCTFAVPDQPPFVIKDAVSRAPDTLAEMTWRSINCAYVRLAQIVGLNRIVDTTYRMAQSVYLYPGQPAERAATRSSRSSASRRAPTR